MVARTRRSFCVGMLIAGSTFAAPPATMHEAREGEPRSIGPRVSRQLQIPGDWRGVRVVAPAAASALRRALDEASRRLLDPRCQQLLTEFADEKGRPLLARLTTLGVDVRVYLGWIQFHDGSSEKCASGWTLMYTTPGGRVVGVCKVAVESAGSSLDHLAATVIHEMLHTLGLTENPPDSADITTRVRRLCWAEAR
jgi:hypothetical protein